MQITIPNNIKLIIETLENKGYEAWVVGGCVRDNLLGKTPKDWDITTSATPEKVIDIFSKYYTIIPTGIKFGTVTIIIEGQHYEVTTYRKDGKYIDGRRPSEIKYTNSLEEDLKRRDFTFNALAYNHNKGLVDLFDGINHLKQRRIVAIGNPHMRFQEDGLRLLRAIRFACQIDGVIDSPTLFAIQECMSFIKNVSKERIRDEFVKIIMSENLVYQQLLALLLNDIMPEWTRCFVTSQNNPYHIYDVANHTIQAIQHIEDNIVLKLSVFFHDIGKPLVKSKDKKGIDHFYNHNIEGTEITRRIMKELRFKNKIIDKVARLVYWHDRPIENTEKAVRKAIRQVGGDIFPDLLKLKIADIKAQNPKYIDRLNQIYDIQNIYEKIMKEQHCLKLKDLAINGKDLLNLGYPQGKIIGEILNYLLEIVIDKPQLNDKDKLIKITKEKFPI